MRRTTLSLLFLTFVSTLLAQQAKQLNFREETFDFGTIEEAKGPVTHEFVFLNNSPRPVKILKVQASCGCTTPGWSKDVIPPGKEGFIQASYNPKGRPGFFTKSLTVTTDLEANPVILQIKGQVTDEIQPDVSDFTVVNGNLKSKFSSFNMGKVFLKDEFVVREFPVINAGSKPLTFSGKFIHPSYMKVNVEPLKLAPGEQALIKISYNGAQKNKYGFQSDNVEIETDDTENPVKSFSVYATLEDFFPQLSAAELARAPQLTLSSSALDLGKIKPNSSREAEVQFTNTGKKELHLKSIQPNCTCVTAQASKTVLKPGDSSIIKIAFNPQARSGTQQKAISVYSNDPRNPVQRFTFTAYIE